MIDRRVIKLCAISIICLSSILIPNRGFSQPNQHNNRIMKADEVAAKIKAARQHNKDIHAALAFFEKRGQPIQWELSSGITGPKPAYSAALQRRESCSVDLQPVSFAPAAQIGGQTSDGGWIELYWITALSLPYEWHGTAVADEYDSFGNLTNEYVAEIVLQMPDHTAYQWNVAYEAPVSGGVVQDPIDGPGLLLTIDASRPLSIQAKAIQRDLNRPKVTPVKWLGGWASWGKCSAAWCGGAAVGCAIANWWNAEIAFGPCAAAGCVGGAIGCTYGTLWN